MVQAQRAGSRSGEQDQRRWVVVAIMAATIASVYPGFLMGALSVQVSAEFGVVESIYGWGLGGFFLAATLGSSTLGRLAQRVGPRRQILAALTVALLMELYIAFFVQRWWWLVAALVVCGLVNAGTQTAVNLALTQAQLPRLGLAIALKQSAMPAASMLGGLAVPTLALTLGWRWAYGLGALITLVAVAGVAAAVGDEGPSVGTQPSSDAGSPVGVSTSQRSGSPRADLVIAALAGGCLSFAAGALNAWVVSSGVDAGLGEAAAGLMLSLGAGTGITLRILVGTRLDTMRVRPFWAAGVTVLFGAMGMAMLAARSPVVHMVATVLAFAGGWVWPVFTNYGIVRTNASTAARATGITQTGVFVGVFVGPLLTGWLIQRYGYPAMWLSVVGVMVVGSALALSIRNRF